ncbi:hypothetical protein C0991_004356, partial [Blastosporella zonata]
MVEYTFLADFDLLADMRQDVCKRPWAKPAARLVMDKHFKIQRAHEEIRCLNIEICHFVTYMQDKEAFLKTREDALLESDANIAHQIWLQQQRLQQ